jgi:hypothetical protein
MQYCHRLLLPNPQFAASVIDFEESVARRAEYGDDLLLRQRQIRRTVRWALR